MKLLILGGTQFVGRHLVEAALAAGHRLTLFNRGQNAAALFPQLALRRGDRRGDLSALAEGEWDAVIDCCGYLPGEVGRMLDCLAGRVGLYVYISSVSAYAGFAQPNNEDSRLGRPADPDGEIVDGASYGPLKAACDRLVRERAARALVIRPGLVVGPHDPTQRFTYWPARVASLAADGEPVLVPGRPEDGLQWIDARDLAAFVVRRTERGEAGVFNVLSGPGQFRRLDLLQACAAVAGLQPRWRWGSDERLVELGVKPWNDLPLWLPPGSEFAGFMQCANAAALAAGLRLRPIEQTVADTLAWWRTLPAAQQRFERAGLTRERESELLRQLRN
ncbi:MAG: NAD-dependent epimerase/dehydratase family protein [Burkholderiaceae bacterium]